MVVAIEPTDESYVAAAKIGGSFGVKGWVKIRSFTDPQENLLEYKSLFFKDKDSMEPLMLDRGRVHGRGLIAHINGVDDRENADLFRGKEILIDISTLPELGEGEYYWRQLVGLRVWCVCSEKFLLIGVVDHLLDTGANDVLVVLPCEGSVDFVERLIPYSVGDIVKKIDLSAGVIEIDWFLDA
mgnify:CR=1 FL=1